MATQHTLDYTQTTFSGDRVTQASQLSDNELKEEILGRRKKNNTIPASESRDFGQSDLTGKYEIQKRLMKRDRVDQFQQILHDKSLFNKIMN